MLSRIEKDEYGEMEIPLNAYYGIHTLRQKELFTVTKFKPHKQLIKSLAIVKKACALSNYDAGYLTEAQVKAIAFACDEVINGRFNNQFITDAIQGGSCTALNTNMNEVVANRANEIMGGSLGTYEYIHPENNVNQFQASNDVIPTAAKHSMIVLAKQLLVELKKLNRSFQDKAKTYNKVIKLGRNHLQDSLPISFGQLFGAMSTTISRDIERLNTAIDGLYEVNLGTGAFGIPYYADNKYVQNILKRFNEFTEMEFVHPQNTLSNARNLDEFVNLSNVLKLMAVNLSKTATDIRLMGSGPYGGFNELILPSYETPGGLQSGQASQSVPEIVNQVCFQIIGKDTTITMAAEHGELEVNAFASIIYPNIYDCLEYLTRSLKLFREYCIDDLVVNEEGCKANILHSNAPIAGLLGHVDFQVCVEIATTAVKTHKTIKEVCMEMKLMDEKKLDHLLDLSKLKFK